MAHFSISGDFITQHARNLWTERPHAALEFLEAAGVEDPTTQIEILIGQKQLTGENSFTIEPDNATTTEYGVNLPSLKIILKQAHDQLKFSQSLCQASSEYVAHSTRMIGTMHHGLNVPISWCDGNSLLLFPGETEEDAYSRIVKHFPDAPYERTGREHIFEPRDIVELRSSIEDDENAPEDSLLQSLLADEQFKLNDAVFSYKDGFVLPDGTFHGCQYMRHVEILEALGKTSEPKDWIKIQDTSKRQKQNLPNEADFVYWTENPTQAQINTIFDWAEKWDLLGRFKFPE